MGKIVAGLIAVFFGLMLAAQPAAASEELAVEPGEGWTHPHSGIVVPYRLGGIERRAALAFADDFLDVGFSFDTTGPDEALSVYIFRNTNGGVPVWFAQAQWAVETRAMYGTVEPLAGPVLFDPHGRGAATGLKAVYRTGESSDFSSTGVALFAAGEWFVKLRASSATRSPEELDAWMLQALSELTVPADSRLSSNVTAMVDCPNRLAFAKKSKDAPQDMGALLLEGMIAGMAADDAESGDAADESAEEAKPVQWCRDHRVENSIVVYRPDFFDDSYLLALGDNGIGVWVGPESGLSALLGAEQGRKKRYTITLRTAGENTNYAAQDRLPSPQRVQELIDANRVVSTVPTWGDQNSIELNSDALD